MSARIRALQARKAEQLKAARVITDAAAADNRDLTADEQTQFSAITASISAINASTEREQALAIEEAGMVASVAATAVAAPTSAVVIPAKATLTTTDNRATDPRRGFAHAGEFMQAVYGASEAHKNGVAIDERLMFNAAAPSTFSGEGVGADGGFLIPPDFSTTIFMHSLGEDSLLPLTDNVNVTGNGMVFPKDETTPWGTNGVRAYWQGESTAATATKPVLGEAALRLKKLMALVPVSNEMLADSNALASYLPKKIGQSIQWKTNEAILFGLGNGTPSGAMNSSAVITVAKESGQATLTLQPINLAKMVARLPAGSYQKAVWLMNNDALPYLFTLNNNNQIYYLPYGGGVSAFQGSPYGSLLGRPIIISQHAKSFTNQGDIMLADLSYYQSITKAQGVTTETSMHLYFDADATAFRTTFRMDGQSKIIASITPANGSNNLSPFVQLGAR